MIRGQNLSDIISKISSIETVDNVEKPDERIRPEVIHRADKPKYDVDPAPAQPLTLHGETPSAQKPPSREPSYTWINLTVGLAIVLWIATVAIVAYSTTPAAAGAPRFTGLQLAALALFAIGPVMIILILGYTLRQMTRLSEQAHSLSRTAQALMSPDDTAYSRSSVMARNIKGEIDQVNTHIDKAVSRMATLRETLEEQVQTIDRVSYLAENKTELIASQLREEREALTAIASAYDDRMAALSANLDTHSANLAKSTQQAEQKINEARISVEGAAAKINTASEIVLKNTVEAGKKLDANQAEIMRLSGELKTRASELDNLYGKHASDLSALISEMRNEQEALGESLEAGLHKMREMSLTSQVSAKHLADASASGRKTVVALADAARLTDTAVKQRFADMEEMVRFSNARAESISEKAARRVQDSLAQTRKEISRIEYDMVELQDRLKYTPAPTDDSEAKPQHTPPRPESRAAPAPETRKRKGISGLKPLPDPEPATAPAPAKPKTAPVADKPQNLAEPAKPKKRLAGLRPAPDSGEQFETPAVSITVDDSGEDADEFADEELLIPAIKPAKAADIAEPKEAEDDEHMLHLEIPLQDDIVAPDTHKDITGFDPDFLRTSEAPQKPAKDTKGKSWWKSLFSSNDENDEVLDRLTAPIEIPDEPTVQDVTDELIVEALAGLGLAPAAIVDDGCIIEAVNTRISRGPLAMSDVITHRLEDPVRHLYDQANLDPALHADMTTFARRFHTSLGDMEDDREAIRKQFESDAGRAFLLCDAALNR